jgi:hypothetical protein
MRASSNTRSEVLDQSFRDFELIVVGDGCTDESARVVNGFGDPRVSWVNLPKRSGHQVGPTTRVCGAREAPSSRISGTTTSGCRTTSRCSLRPSRPERRRRTRRCCTPTPARCRIAPTPGWSYTRGAWVPPSTLAVLRDTTLAIGGWRDARLTGNLDPENDLVARIFDLVGPPAWAPR